MSLGCHSSTMFKSFPKDFVYFIHILFYLLVWAVSNKSYMYVSGQQLCKCRGVTVENWPPKFLNTHQSLVSLRQTTMHGRLPSFAAKLRDSVPDPVLRKYHINWSITLCSYSEIAPMTSHTVIASERYQEGGWRNIVLTTQRRCWHVSDQSSETPYHDKLWRLTLNKLPSSSLHNSRGRLECTRARKHANTHTHTHTPYTHTHTRTHTHKHVGTHIRTQTHS